MRVLRWLVLALVGVAAFISLLWLAAQTALVLPQGQRALKTFLERRLESLFAGTVSIGSIHSNAATWVQLRNVAVDLTDKPDSLALERLTVTIFPAALVFRTLYIRSVKADHVRVLIRRTPSGQFPIPLRPKPSTKPSRWRVAVERAELRDVEATYIDSARSIRARVEEGRAAASLIRPDSIDVEIGASAGHIQSSPWAGQIDRLHLQGTIHSKVIDLSRISISSGTSRIDLSGRIPLTAKASWDVHAQAQLSLDSLAAQGKAGGLAPSGRLFLDASLQGTLDAPHLQAELSARTIGLWRQSIDSLHGLAEYKGDTLRFSAMLSSGIGDVRAAGAARISTLLRAPRVEGYAAQAEIGRAKPWLAFSKFPAGALKGTVVNGRAGIRGNGIGFPDSVGISARTSGGKIFRRPATLEASLEAGNWELISAWASNHITGQGTYGSGGKITGSLAAAIEQPTAIANLFDQIVTGSARIRARLSGTIRSPLAALDAGADRLAWNSLILSAVHATGQYESGRLTITSATGTVEGALGPVFQTFGVDSVSGTMQALVRASGPVRRPVLQADVRGRNVYFNRFSAPELKGRIQFTPGDSLAWSDLTFSRMDTSLITSGALTLASVRELRAGFRLAAGASAAGSGRLRMRLEPDSIEGTISTDRLNAAAIEPWVFPGRSIQGLLTVEAKWSGARRNPSVHARATIMNAGYGTYRASQIQGSARLVDSLLRFDARALTLPPKSAVLVDGSLPLRPGRGWSIDTAGFRLGAIRAVCDSLHLAAAAQWIPSQISAQGLGRFDARIAQHGSTWRINGSANIESGTIDYLPAGVTASTVRLQSDLAGTLRAPRLAFSLRTGNVLLASQKVDSSFWRGSVSADTIRLDTGFARFANGGTARVRGEVPLASLNELLGPTDPGLEFQLTRVPLQALQPLVPDLIIKEGTLEGEANLVLENGRLTSTGAVALTGGIFAVTGVRKNMGPINGTLRFAGDSILIHNLEGRLGKGTVTARGFLVLSGHGPPRVDLELLARNPNIALEDLGTIWVQFAQVHLASAQGDTLAASGTVRLGETRLTRDYSIAQLVRQAGLGRRPSRPNAFLQRLKLDLKIDIGQNLFLDMNLGDMQLDGNLVVTGTAAQPGIVGDIRVVQGTVNYLDRRFEINKGVALLTSPFTFNPVIDLAATTQVMAYAAGSAQTIDYTVNLFVTGDLQRPEIVLTSSPPLDEPDILSVLVLGSTTGDVGGDLAGRIGSLAGQGLLGFGTRPLEQILGLESFRISGNVFGPGGETGPGVTLSKRVSRRLLITYETGLTRAGTYSVSAVLRLLPYLFIVGETGQQERANISLRLRVTR